MTADVNAAIEGAFIGGATEVVVADGHGNMSNILNRRLGHTGKVGLWKQQSDVPTGRFG